MKRAKPYELRPVHPNAGLACAYRRRIVALLAEMHAEVLAEVTAAYRENTPEMASDDLGMSPARSLIATMRKLGRTWQRRFDDLAPELAAWFAKDVTARSDAALATALRKAGFTVRFGMTRKVNDIVQASIGENVSLIKSIPAQYLTQVQGAVLRGVQAGADVGSITKALQEQAGVSKRRAALIATDQNRKATSMIVRARQQQSGITQAKWLHSGGGKTPRPTHVAAGREGVIYNVAEGWYDPAVKRRIWPGSEISCRCVSIPVIPGLSRP